MPSKNGCCKVGADVLRGKGRRGTSRVRLDEVEVSDFIQSKLLLKNVVWSGGGRILPLIVSLITVPILINGLGVDKYGMLSLFLAIIGYFGLFDFGLGRATTQSIASALGRGEREFLQAIIGTSLLSIVAFGVIGGVVLGVSGNAIANHLFSINAQIAREGVISLLLLSATIPLIITIAALGGVLGAYQQFRTLSLLKFTVSILGSLAPVAVVKFSTYLPFVVGSIILVRVIELCSLVVICFRLVPAFRQGLKVDLTILPRLLSFGGWMTVTNVIGPVLVYFDRFIIAGMLSMAAVAYYTTPYAVASKISIIPITVMSVMFPAFATAIQSAPQEAARIFRRVGVGVTLLVVAPAAVIVAFGEEILTVWINPDFAAASGYVFGILAVGVFINCMAQILFGLVQAIGKPDYTAKLHAIEALFYLPMLWFAVKTGGLAGAAVVWTARVSVDALLLGIGASRLVPATHEDLRALGLLWTGIYVVLIVLFVVDGLTVRLGILTGSSILLARHVWRRLLTQGERAWLSRCATLRLRARGDA